MIKLQQHYLNFQKEYIKQPIKVRNKIENYTNIFLNRVTNNYFIHKRLDGFIAAGKFKHAQKHFENERAINTILLYVVGKTKDGSKITAHASEMTFAEAQSLHRVLSIVIKREIERKNEQKRKMQSKSEKEIIKPMEIKA